MSFLVIYYIEIVTKGHARTYNHLTCSICHLRFAEMGQITSYQSTSRSSNHTANRAHFIFLFVILQSDDSSSDTLKVPVWFNTCLKKTDTSRWSLHHCRLNQHRNSTRGLLFHVANWNDLRTSPASAYDLVFINTHRISNKLSFKKGSDSMFHTEKSASTDHHPI